MLRSFFARAIPLCLAALMASVVGTADAQVKPFKIEGHGYAPEGLRLPRNPAFPPETKDPAFHLSTGTATHLGRHTGSGFADIVTYPTPETPESPAAPGTFGSGLQNEVGVQDGYVFVGANGDKLVCDYGRDADGVAVGIWIPTFLENYDDGTALVQVTFVAEFVPRPDESTGKFRGVEGSWIMYAHTEPFVADFAAETTEPFAYTWEGKGELKFRKGGRKSDASSRSGRPGAAKGRSGQRPPAR